MHPTQPSPYTQKNEHENRAMNKNQRVIIIPEHGSEAVRTENNPGLGPRVRVDMDPPN
jgi:hypothetical protein